MDKKVLILGVGNILLCDEGFGVKAVEFLRSAYTFSENVTLADGGTLGMLLIPDMQSADLVVVLDVVKCGGAPGTFYLLSGDDLRKSIGFKDSTHQTDLADILVYCALNGHEPETVIIGMEPFDMETFMPHISIEAERLLPEFCSKVIDYLRQSGIPAESASNRS